VLLFLVLLLYFGKAEREKLYNLPIISKFIKLPPESDKKVDADVKVEEGKDIKSESLNQEVPFLHNEEFVSVIFDKGGTIEGRVIERTIEGDYVLEIPEGQFSISHDEIKDVRKLTGEVATGIKEMIDKDSSFKYKQKRVELNVNPFFDGNVRWENDISVALEKTKADDRLVIVDFTSNWCGWCKRLNEETFQDKEVREKLNRYFVCVRIDGDKRKDLVVKYGIRGYPHIMFLDEGGIVIYRIPGFVPAKQFLKIINTVLQLVQKE